MKAVGNAQERALARNKMRSAISKAKTAYWQDQIDNARIDTDLYRIAKWRKKASLFAPPGLEGWEDKPVADQLTEITKRLLVQEPRGTVKQREESWPEPLEWAPFTPSEIRESTIEVSTTAAGTDGITVPILKAVWDQIGGRVTELFNEALERGDHPFKECEVVLLPKAERDPKKEKGWRPIALLSVLGKGLERAVAKRLGETGIEKGWFGPLQAGGIPGRSAVDLARVLTHLVEKKHVNKEYTAIVLMDVKGAFNAAGPDHMAAALEEVGAPTQAVRWVTSLMTGRTLTPRRGKEHGTLMPLNSGLPQGSPASPVLFSILLSVMARKQGRFAYADDILVIKSHRNAATAAKEAQDEAERAIKDIEDSGLEIEPSKTEFMVFKKRDTSGIKVTIKGQDLEPKEVCRYLGIYIDKNLTFATHVKNRCKATAGSLALLRRLGGTTKGLPTKAARKFIISIILPSLMYGSELWWKGILPKGKRSTQHFMVSDLNRVLNAAK